MKASPFFLLAVVGGGAGGWFILSWKVMDSSPGQAANEAIGAVLGLLVLVSIIGAFRSTRKNADRRRRHP